MRAAAERRLAELDAQAKAGAKLLAEQEAQAAATRATLLRIDGARQVLLELIAEEPAP